MLINRIKGFSLFELVVALTIIGVLIAIAINKLPAWQAAAEQAAVESVAGSMRSALGIKVASFIARGEVIRIADLVGSNPVEQLAEIPENYIGVRQGANNAGVEGGYWYFDATARQIAYRVRYTDFFRAPPGVAEVRYTVELVYEDRNRNGRYDESVDRVGGVRLVQMAGAGWNATGSVAREGGAD